MNKKAAIHESRDDLADIAEDFFYVANTLNEIGETKLAEEAVILAGKAHDLRRRLSFLKS